MPSKLTGDKELRRTLASIGRGMGGSNLDKACVKALEPLKDRTVQNARRLRQPGRTPKGGHLDQGVVVRRMSAPTIHRRIYWVAFKGRARRIAHLVEFGTAPHYQPRRGRMHPGARPRRFFTRAFESTKRDVVEEFRLFMQARLRSLMSQYGRRPPTK